MRRSILVLLLALSSAAAAEAQNRKFFSLGVGLSFHDYSDSRLASKELDIVPMYRFSKGGVSEDGWGWDMKSSIGFSGVDLPTEVGGAEYRLGKLRTIPLMLGLARAYRQGPMKLSAWATCGPSFNNLEIDNRAVAAYQAAGSNLEAVHAKTSFAFKPGVSASYRLSSVLALAGSLSYTINRPEVRTRIDGVSTSERWKLDRSSGTLGIVLGLL